MLQTDDDRRQTDLRRHIIKHEIVELGVHTVQVVNIHRGDSFMCGARYQVMET